MSKWALKLAKRYPPGTPDLVAGFRRTCFSWGLGFLSYIAVTTYVLLPFLSREGLVVLALITGLGLANSVLIRKGWIPAAIAWAQFRPDIGLRWFEDKFGSLALRRTLGLIGTGTNILGLGLVVQAGLEGNASVPLALGYCAVRLCLLGMGIRMGTRAYAQFRRLIETPALAQTTL